MTVYEKVKLMSKEELCRFLATVYNFGWFDGAKRVMTRIGSCTNPPTRTTKCSNTERTEPCGIGKRKMNL